ncbi:dihydroflavonol-4-reductase [Devosia enhydra]|uniref:Dihydroflavonol-4-reductase n=1 Tax=Devosia enhydra TaxID=665118 RepID=A0A1K2HT35_9HYPH|nr:NAD-dependent epimerase/dehydratase family protein [Devosia enhydra]SFZ81140.1 dihydroflavonol-4-reductase [Devosia enhydra]
MAGEGRGLVLVTGASGFVGKWTVIELLRAGFSVRGTVRSEAKAEQVRKAVTVEVGGDSLSRLSFAYVDLLADKGWPDAMRGVAAVMHVATVIRGDEPRDSSLVIRPAVEGTERVLRFARDAGITRIVMTSSIATVGYGHGQVSGKKVYDETFHTNLDGMKFTWAYCIGKTRAEQSAWSFCRANGIDLTTIHPGAIIGPALDDDASISIQMVTGLLDGTTPAMPSNGFAVVDVRDVAALHVAALLRPEAAGERYLATAEYVPFTGVGDVLREAYPQYEVTIRTVPDWLIGLLARFGGPARQIINDIGNEKHYDRTKSEALLGRPYRSGKEAILASAESALRLGLCKPKPKVAKA